MTQYAICSVFAVGLLLGQAPAAAELKAYEEYRAWVTRQPVAVQRGADVLDAYKAYLIERGADAADAETAIRMIRTRGRDAEVERWNRILTAENPRFNVKPNAFLVEMVMGRKPGRSLDIGMGQGRNAIWLAQQGWESAGFDPAERAVALALANAKRAGVMVKAEVKGSEEFVFGEAQWDLIVLSYVSFREQASKIERALRPGGVVVVEGFHRDATRGSSIGGGVVFDTGELPGLFPQLRVVRYQEPMAVADFGQSLTRVVQYCGEKPAQ